MTRVTVPVGEDIGFLPGTEEEKMTPWMGAPRKPRRSTRPTTKPANAPRGTRDLIRSRIKEVAELHARPHVHQQFLIIDEAQNLTPKQMKTLITRAGSGTKVVCLGGHRADRHAVPDRKAAQIDLCRRSLQGVGSQYVTLMPRSRLADHAADVL
jgi:PhoH-like ATPase